MTTKKILYVHYGDAWVRGSERCLLDLLTHLNTDKYEPFVWTNNSMLIPHLEELRIPYQLDDFPILMGWNSPKVDVKSWIKLIGKGRQLITEQQIDLVHVNSAAPCQWMALAARYNRCPMTTHLHSDYIGRDRMTLGLHLSPYIITASNAISQNLKRDGFPAERLEVVHNGIDIERLEIQPQVDVKQRLKIGSDAVVFATVGSLIYRKGIDRIMVALRHLLLEYPNSHLVVIGEGEERENLNALCQKLHLEQNVHFVGEQANVVGWLKGCDAFVSGAREEAFGLVVTEAAIAKRTVIAPFEGGIPEIIHHGQTGLLYVNQGFGPIFDMMRCVHSHPQECQVIAKSAYQHVKQHFSVLRYVAQIEALYSRLLTLEELEFPPLKDNLKPVKTALAKRKAKRNNKGGDHASS